MKIPLLFLSILSSVIVTAQQRYLVTPDQQYRPLDHKSQTAADAISGRMAAERKTASSCTNRYTFGNTPGLYPPNTIVSAYHLDVMGQWYVAKASGTIDTIFWMAGPSIGARDSLVVVRIHNSFIGPDYGPGIRDYAHGVNFPPPCENWGYWNNTMDPDQHVAAFLEDATDTIWHSTINNAPQPSRPPFGDEIWGLGGQVFPTHANTISSAAMMSLGMPCDVTTGQKFLISQAVYAQGHVAYDKPTQWYASAFRVTNSDENYPSRNWRFYEHDSGPANCAGLPVTLVKRGWVARGGIGGDSLAVLVYNWWYTMTAVTNVPPLISDLPDETGIPHTTLSTAAQHVTVQITDCDPGVPGNTGSIQAAYIEVSTAPTVASGSVFTRLPDVTLVPTVGDQYEGDIPGQIAGTTISWRVRAVDNKGLIAYSPSHFYKIVSLRNQTYYVDTSYTPVWQNISSTGTPILPQELSIQQRVSGDISQPARTPDALDDGTAGPFDLGGTITYFGKPLRYAWIGVNGALGLSSDSNDAIDINNNGFWTSAWDFPGLQRMGRSDTVNFNRMPRAFISPLWSDLTLGDQSHPFGRIVHGPGANASCEHVIEWDSVGTFDESGAPVADLTTFRVILNKCDNSIEYQWDNVGTHNQAATALVGMQGYADSLEMVGTNPPFVDVSKAGWPTELKPRNHRGMKFLPIGSLGTQPGWQLLSAYNDRPMPVDSMWVPHLGKVFGFRNGHYSIADTIYPGYGYWVKSSNPFNGMIFGKPKNQVQIPVTQGWNIIGSIMTPLPVASIVTDANTMIDSRFFGYNHGYTNMTTITPGLGYFVKINLLNGATTGTLTLTAP